jgi:hypothetical protein
MPVHDWTQVDAGIYHALHAAWIPLIQRALNDGLLPQGYYALAEQHAGRSIADVLTLHASTVAAVSRPGPLATGGTAVADAPPRVHRRQTVPATAAGLRRSLAVRHVSGHRLVALIEILSPANKDRRQTIDTFVTKVVDALDLGIHVLVIDLFPPGPHDPRGIHGLIQQRLAASDELYDLPSDKPMSLASYAAGPEIEIFLSHVAVGESLLDMPLFFTSDRYISVPLEKTYEEAYRGMPEFWRDVLEGRQSARSN